VFVLSEVRTIELQEQKLNSEEKETGLSIRDLEVRGTVVIKDKDGNIKQELKIHSLEMNEDKQDADS
jgi:hypothetical protein